ncbi:MAG: phosphoribosylglycinamide formyltransferase protein [Actinomycetia bacterium]|nr:phosphoribosylglycinamide formyltransferase protein [Actinomycetes bacterium]
MGIDRVREICTSFPDAEVIADGPHHKLQIRRKNFGWHMVGERESLVVKVPAGDNEILVAADPDRFFLPASVAEAGYVGLHLDGEYVGWDEVRDLLTEAYRLVAPRRLASRLG